MAKQRPFPRISLAELRLVERVVYEARIRSEITVAEYERINERLEQEIRRFLPVTLIQPW